MPAILTASFSNGGPRQFVRDGFEHTQDGLETVVQAPRSVLKLMGTESMAIDQQLSSFVTELKLAVIWRDEATGYRFGLAMYIGQFFGGFFGKDPQWAYMGDREKSGVKAQWHQPAVLSEPFAITDQILGPGDYSVTLFPTIYRNSMDINVSIESSNNSSKNK